MKSEDLIKLKEKYFELQSKRNEVLEIKNEIAKLEETDVIKRYLELKNNLKEKTSLRNTGFDKFTDDELISIALGDIEYKPDDDVYVYIGTYKYNYEMDIVHGSSDKEVNRYNSDADYVIYKNLEAKYNGEIEVPYQKADEFEANHKIIFPKNVAFNERYFYDLQDEYFATMILETPEEANKKINKLIKK